MIGKVWTEEFSKYLIKIIWPATIATIKIVFFTMLIGIVFGMLLAIILTLYGDKGLKPRKRISRPILIVINFIRSLPGIILIVTFIPLTKYLVGTTIGVKAVIVPLGISAMAFIAKALEDSFVEVDRQLIEAARSFGASNFQIVTKVIIRESIPSIISVFTMSTVYYIAGSTLAGAVGGGGLGAVALTYGYQSFNDKILYTCVVIIYLMVQFVEYLGKFIYKKIV